MNNHWKYKYQLYKHLQANTQEIYADIRKAGEEIGITSELRGTFGLTGAVSGCHGLLVNEVTQAMEDGARKIITSASLDEKIREVVKDHYGDEYDAALVNTCEAALFVSFEVMCMPPLGGRGSGYRGRYIAPYERHIHHQAGYGRPFPPKYKEYTSERGETAGEYGMHGKRINDLDTVLVRLEGASYDCHGIKYSPAPHLVHVDAAATLEKFKQVAQRHADLLVGFASLGYDTPGYGYGDRVSDTAGALQVGLAKLARSYDVPYVIDNAWGTPFIGTDIREVGCDLMLYSMDKSAGAPTSGLIIGKEEPMVQIRRALGIHGARYGTLSSHGKSAYVTIDPGKEALLGTLAALKILKEKPEIALEALDGLYQIVIEEFDALPEELKRGWKITKSLNSLAVELNYADSWSGGRGLPIFTIEDMYAGSNLVQAGFSQMGIVPTIGYDGNIFVSNGLGNTDKNGQLIEKPTRLAIRGVFKIMEILGKWAGVLEEAKDFVPA